MKKLIPFFAFLVSMLAVALVAEELSTTYGGSSTKPGLAVQRARGHQQAKEHIFSGDVLNGIYGRGYDGSAFSTGNDVGIELQASQDWTTTAQGTKIVFIATPDDSTTPATIWTIGSGGSLTSSGNFTITGTTVTLSGVVAAGGGFLAYGRTEAELKVSTPTVVNMIWRDTTNSRLVQSTGTSNCADYAKLEDATAVPTGW